MGSIPGMKEKCVEPCSLCFARQSLSSAALLGLCVCGCKWITGFKNRNSVKLLLIQLPALSGGIYFLAGRLYSQVTTMFKMVHDAA
jgi:hypothetical protein